jgi:hypothetical protein
VTMWTRFSGGHGREFGGVGSSTGRHSELNDARICPADRNTTRDAALSPSPHAGSNWNLHRMGRGCPEDG